MSRRRSAWPAAMKDTPLRELNATDIADDELVAGDDGEAASDQEKACRKKRKLEVSNFFNQGGQPVPKKARGIRGMLKDMIEMPMDVLYEIFSQLYPIDLVHLSRTSKDLRAMLMSRTSISIWKTARANITPAMPECPDDMSEAEYAELAFGKGCQYCSRKIGTLHRAWDARRRICNKCIPEHCALVSNSDPPESLRALFAGTDIDLCSKLPHVFVESPKSKIHGHHCFVEYYKMWEEELPKLNTVQERIEWLQNKSISAEKHRLLCLSWVEDFVIHQKQTMIELTKARKARLWAVSRIVKRVKELGWSDEVDKMSISEEEFQDLENIVKLCRKEITERTWSNLDSRINDYMEGVKRHRLARERKVLLKERLPVLEKVYSDCKSNIPFSERTICVTPGELLLEPPIINIIINLPQDKTLAEEDLLPAVTAILPQANQRLRARIEDQLLKHIHDARKELGDESVVDRDTAFSLATTIFRCDNCLSPSSFWFKEIVSHRCTKAKAFPKELRDRGAFREYLKEGYRTHETGIKVDALSVKVITELIKLCGLDPSTTTRQMMDDLNPIFECLRCHSIYDGRLMMTWDAVVQHRNRESRHRGEEIHQFKPVFLNGEEADIARTRIAELQFRRWGQNSGCVVVCAHCGESDHSRARLVGHVKEKHGITKVTPEDFVPDLNQDQVPPSFRMWPPLPEVKGDASMEAMDLHVGTDFNWTLTRLANEARMKLEQCSADALNIEK